VASAGAFVPPPVVREHSLQISNDWILTLARCPGEGPLRSIVECSGWQVSQHDCFWTWDPFEVTLGDFRLQFEDDL